MEVFQFSRFYMRSIHCILICIWQYDIVKTWSIYSMQIISKYLLKFQIDKYNVEWNIYVYVIKSINQCKLFFKRLRNYFYWEDSFHFMIDLFNVQHFKLLFPIIIIVVERAFAQLTYETNIWGWFSLNFICDYESYDDSPQCQKLLLSFLKWFS